MKMQCSTYQRHNDSNTRILNRSLRISSPKADIQRAWSDFWQNISLEWFIYVVTVATIRVQEKESVFANNSAKTPESSLCINRQDKGITNLKILTQEQCQLKA